MMKDKNNKAENDILKYVGFW